MTAGCLLDYYATRGASLRSVTVDDAFRTAGIVSDRGHPIFRIPVELPRGATTTIELHLREPAGSGRPQLWTQPGVRPQQVVVQDQAC